MLTKQNKTFIKALLDTLVYFVIVIMWAILLITPIIITNGSAFGIAGSALVIIITVAWFSYITQ